MRRKGPRLVSSMSSHLVQGFKKMALECPPRNIVYQLPAWQAEIEKSRPIRQIFGADGSNACHVSPGTSRAHKIRRDPAPSGKSRNSVLSNQDPIVRPKLADLVQN